MDTTKQMLYDLNFKHPKCKTCNRTFSNKQELARHACGGAPRVALRAPPRRGGGRAAALAAYRAGRAGNVRGGPLPRPVNPVDEVAAHPDDATDAPGANGADPDADAPGAAEVANAPGADSDAVAPAPDGAAEAGAA